MFHSDQETSSQAAYFVGTDGTKGWRTAWRAEPEPEAGEPEVHVPPVQGSKMWLHHLCRDPNHLVNDLMSLNEQKPGGLYVCMMQ